jgi:hypothetical protein
MKIYCAVEKWDSILDYWKPNMWPESWFLKEEKTIKYPFSLFPNTVEKFHQSINYRETITPSIPNVEYLKYTDIPSDEKYIYLVPIQPIDFFEKNNLYGFNFINFNILEDIRNNRCKIVLLMQHEGNVGSSHLNFKLENFNKWCDLVKIPYKNVYLIHGNLKFSDMDYKKNVNINVIPISVFDSWIYDKKFKYTIADYTGDKIFLNYNRQPRDHRLLFVCELLRHDLLDKGIVSFNTAQNLNIKGAEHSILNYNHLLKDASAILINKYNGVLHTDTKGNENLAININLKHHVDSFISVVSETWIFEDMIFFSEKTWKPIMLGHPFILIGNPGSLAELKSMGYKTFDKWINEKYDENLPLIQRYNIILSELKKFTEKSKDELISIRNEMRDICIHNKKVFFDNYDKNGSEMVRIYKILEKIVNA